MSTIDSDAGMDHVTPGSYRIGICSESPFILAAVQRAFKGATARDGRAVLAAGFSPDERWDALVLDPTQPPADRTFHVGSGTPCVILMPPRGFKVVVPHEFETLSGGKVARNLPDLYEHLPILRPEPSAVSWLWLAAAIAAASIAAYYFVR